MQFTTIALTFVAAVAAINPTAKEAFVANYIANAKRAVNATSNATTSAGASSAAGGASTASASTALPVAAKSDATIMALSGSALFAGVVALVL